MPAIFYPANTAGLRSRHGPAHQLLPRFKRCFPACGNKRKVNIAGFDGGGGQVGRVEVEPSLPAFVFHAHLPLGNLHRAPISRLERTPSQLRFPEILMRLGCTRGFVCPSSVPLFVSSKVFISSPFSTSWESFLL